MDLDFESPPPGGLRLALDLAILLADPLASSGDAKQHKSTSSAESN